MIRSSKIRRAAELAAVLTAAGMVLSCTSFSYVLLRLKVYLANTTAAPRRQGDDIDSSFSSVKNIDDELEQMKKNIK